MNDGGCLHGDGIVICRPRSFNWRSRRDCPTCGRVRWMLVAMAVWYPATITCLGCGEQWDAEAGRYPRPFERAWRDKSIRFARSRPWTTKAAAFAALNDEIEEYTA